MNTEEYIKIMFTQMVCSCCDHRFTPDCVEIIRIEGNCAIVKLECTTCHKNYGIAVVGIETVEEQAIEQENVLIPDLPPITSDDVIEAHKFIDKLGADWTKYIPDEFKITTEE